MIRKGSTAAACVSRQDSRLPRWLVLDPRYQVLTRSQLLVVGVIQLHAAGSDGRSWPGMRCIAEETGLHLDTVHKAVASILKSGLFLKTWELVGNPARWGNCYRLDRSATAERESVRLQQNGEPRRAFGFCASDRSDSGVATVRLQPNKTLKKNTQKEHLDTTTSCVLNPVGESTPTADRGGGGDASQELEEPTADIEQPELWKALVKCGIGEPALSELAGNPWIDARMVHHVDARCGEIGQGSGIVIPELRREARAAKLKHDEEEREAEAILAVQADEDRRMRRYELIVRQHADAGQLALIKDRWPCFNHLAGTDPLPGQQLFDLDPKQALHKIMDAVHGATEAST